MKIAIRESRLSVDEVIDAVARPTAGGLSVFIGAVRNHSDGREVTKLEYSAYVSMAEREMARIAEEIEREVAGTVVSAIHRVGELAVGDAAIVCAASAPHRGEAFRACRLLIDRIKERVPIWKRETGPDGAAWVGWVDARCASDGHDHAHEAELDHAGHGHRHGD